MQRTCSLVGFGLLLLGSQVSTKPSIWDRYSMK